MNCKAGFFSLSILLVFSFAHLIITLIGGLATHQEIDGVSYQNVMPAHPEMKDQEVANVLTYIRNNFSNKASSVKASEVKTVRTQMKKSS